MALAFDAKQPASIPKALVLIAAYSQVQNDYATENTEAWS
jgi:hypothetical protein